MYAHAMHSGSWLRKLSRRNMREISCRVYVLTSEGVLAWSMRSCVVSSVCEKRLGRSVGRCHRSCCAYRAPMMNMLRRVVCGGSSELVWYVAAALLASSSIFFCVIISILFVVLLRCVS